jgi:hypothetical protein
VLASIALVALAKDTLRQAPRPMPIPARAPTLNLGFTADSGPVIWGADRPIMVGLGSRIEPVVTADWAGGPESRVRLFCGDRELAPGQSVTAERPGRMVFRAEAEGGAPAPARLELGVSNGPEHRLDIEVRAEAAAPDGAEWFTVLVRSKSLNLAEVNLQGVTLLIRSSVDMGILYLKDPLKGGGAGGGEPRAEYREGARVLRFCRRNSDPPLPSPPREFSMRASGTVGTSRMLGGFVSLYVSEIGAPAAASDEARVAPSR